jgi:Mn2+/Fe2+ NRAMP family transporter
MRERFKKMAEDLSCIFGAGFGLAILVASMVLWGAIFVAVIAFVLYVIKTLWGAV